GPRGAPSPDRGLREDAAPRPRREVLHPHAAVEERAADARRRPLRPERHRRPLRGHPALAAAAAHGPGPRPGLADEMGARAAEPHRADALRAPVWGRPRPPARRPGISG